MTKYEACFNEVKEVEVEKETDAFVYIRGRRESKRTDWRSYFDTREVAIGFITERQKAKVERARLILQAEEKQLAELEKKFAA